jgi:hypothetical protein
MRICIARQFGTSLVSHPAGCEAFAALEANVLHHLPAGEHIEVDFTGLDVLTPSWADEFITGLRAKYGDRLVLLPSDNPSVQLTLEAIGQSSKT